MKRLFLVRLFLLSLVSFSYAAATPVVMQQELTNLVDTAFTTYKQRHADDRTLEKKGVMIAKIKIYTQMSHNVKLTIALNHLITLIEARIPKIGMPGPIETPVYLGQDTLTYEAGYKTILAGVESPIIGKLNYTAQNEDILIDTFVITGTRSLGDYFEEIYIYDARGKRILTIPTTTERVELHDLARRLPQGQNTFWITVLPKAINNNSTADQVSNISLTFAPTRLISSTNKTAYASTQRHTSDRLTITPVLIESIAFVDEALQRKRDMHLVDGTINLGIIALTTAERNNTRESASKTSNLKLHTLRIGVNDGTVAQQIKPTVMLKRLWTAMSAIAGSIDGDSVVFDLSSQGSYAQLKSATTTYRLVTTTPQLTPWSSESAQLLIEDLLGGAITFSSDEPGSDVITQLSLPENTIEWPVVYE